MLGYDHVWAFSMWISVNIVGSSVGLNACYHSALETSHAPGNVLCLGNGLTFLRDFPTVCTLVDLRSSWLVLGLCFVWFPRENLCVVTIPDIVCCYFYLMFVSMVVRNGEAGDL